MLCFRRLTRLLLPRRHHACLALPSLPSLPGVQHHAVPLAALYVFAASAAPSP
jgi:hypothetical protein